MIPDEISKQVTVEDQMKGLFGGMFTIQKDDMLVIGQRPDWVRHPLTQEKFYVQDMFVADYEIMCPACRGRGKHGIIILEKPGMAVLCCVNCKQFVWTKRAKRS